MEGTSMKPLVRALVVSLALGVASLATAEIWTIDSAHTVAGFTARHMMITNVTGVFEATSGTIDYTPGNPGATKADVAIEAKSINTRNARRDTHLKTDDFINVEKFPAITFKSKRVQNVRPDGFDLVGDLTIREVTKEVVPKVDGIAAPIKDPQGNRRVGANATTTINRKDFGVNYNRALEAGGVLIGDEVKINIEIQAVEKKG
jgi:polyisoprenoid-binding protein YceI